MGAIPIGLGVLGLPVLAAVLIAVAGTLAQVALLHCTWSGLMRQRRLRAYLERRRMPRLRGWVDRRGLGFAVFCGGLAAGPLPTYASLRFLGVSFGGPAWAATALSASTNAASVLGVCAIAGLA